MLQQILQEIQSHNEQYLNSVPYNQKIDFSKTKKSWGSDVIPEQYWISGKNKYKTSSGNDVVITNIVMKNSTGNEVTFPVKGYWIEKKGNKIITHNCIWTLDGRLSIRSTEPDLVRV